MNELTTHTTASTDKSFAAQGTNSLLKALRTRKTESSEGASFANFLTANITNTEEIATLNKDVNELAFRAAYKMHLLQSVNALQEEVGELSQEQQEKLKALLKHISQKLLQAQEQGDITLSKSTEEKLEAFLSDSTSIADFVESLNDPAFFADLQAALAQISPSEKSDTVQKILDQLDKNDEIKKEKDLAEEKVAIKNGDVISDKSTSEKETTDNKQEETNTNTTSHIIPSESSSNSETKEDISDPDAIISELSETSIEEVYKNILSLLQSADAQVQQNTSQTPIKNSINGLTTAALATVSAKQSGDIFKESASRHQDIKASLVDAQQAVNTGKQATRTIAQSAEQSTLGTSADSTNTQVLQQAFNSSVDTDSFKSDLNQAFQAVGQVSSQQAGQATTAALKGHNTPHQATQQVAIQMSRLSGNKNEFRIQLNPRELGHVDVRMTIDKDGHTRATILAEKPETLSILQRDAQILERALQSAGLNTTSQDLSFGLKDSNAQNDFARMTHKGKDNGQNTLETDGIDTLSSHNITEQIFSHNHVNYRA